MTPVSQKLSSLTAVRALLSLALAILALAPVVVSQVASNQLSAYTDAVARVQPWDRLIQLERFAIHAQPGPLKAQALEFVIWEYLRNNNVAHALTWANELYATDKDNALAIALRANNRRVEVENGTVKPERLLNIASHGLDMLPQLERPLGMTGGDFTLLKRQAYAMLSSVAGMAELRMKDCVAARDYLHNTIALEGNNPRDMYNLALADLNGPDQNPKEGYWYLARAVDLSRGTPQGRVLARSARARYMKDGGSTGDWDQFLAAAAPANAMGEQATVLASATPPKLPPIPERKTASPAGTAGSRPPSVPERRNAQPPRSVWADNTPPPIVRKRALSTTGPMSLGILVETSLTNKDNRSAVVNSLIDMLRRMNDRDEAFILTYDNNLVFEQDLTSDPHQLEEAMESIKPQKGAVLDDAVAFSAGHLARIAKYPNRVLLLISDGKNVDSHASPVQTSAEINSAGVRFYCIGVDVVDRDGQYRLRELAASTGGQSRFISTPGQFRLATRDIAQNIGIDFRF